MEKIKSFSWYREWYDIVRMFPAEERLAAFDAILSHVFYPEQETTAGPIAKKYIIPLIDQQLARQEEIIDKRRTAGAMGGNAKAKKAVSGERLAVSGERLEFRDEPNGANGANGEDGMTEELGTKVSRTGRRYEPRNGELFVVFWDRYALKKDKEGAIRAWNRLSDKEQEEAVNGIEAYKKQCEDEQRARMFPQGYLSHHRWEDEPASITNKKETDGKEGKDKLRRGVEVSAEKPSDFGTSF